jgi:ribosome-binding ATPase YchF (GTP1/OBG family)
MYHIGYGSTISVVAKFMDKLAIKDPLETWDDAMVGKVVDGFLDERFPTVVALNKIDMADADKNITKIMRKYDPVSNCVPLKTYISGCKQ